MTLVPKPATIPRGKVWVQGKLRDKASKAARNQRLREEQRAEKGFRRANLGQTVFAYSNLRTNQVVYSLTRFLEDTKILPQLLYHGKKTVPSNLRKDHWTPYFSIHFPTSKHGLTAYRYLRELSAIRQLDPPKSMLKSTMATLFKYDAANMYNRDLDEDRPKVGRTLSRKLKARVLMDQKAFSVADVAFVLGLQHEVGPNEEKVLRVPKHERGGKSKSFLKAVQARQDSIEHLQRTNREQLAIARNPSVGFSDLAKARIEEAKESKSMLAGSENSTDKIAVLWADLRDATYAEAWPTTVYHGLLDSGLRIKIPSSLTHKSVHVAGDRSDEYAQPAETTRDGRIDNQDVVLPSKSLTLRVKDALLFWRN